MRARRSTQRLALLVLTAALAACTTTVRQHPQYQARVQTLRRAALVPPEVEVIRLVFKGANEELTPTQEAVAARLPELIASQLRSRGFVVKDAQLEEGDFEADPELRFETTQIRRAFAEASQEMYKTPEMWKSDALAYEKSIGPRVNLFVDHADVDALAFAKFSAFEKSGGEVAKDVALTVLVIAASLGNTYYTTPTRGASLEVALVCGDTGDILWANVATIEGDFKGRGLEKLVANVFKPLPQRPPE